MLAMGGGVPSSTSTEIAARTDAGCISIMFTASLEEERTIQPISSRFAPPTTNSFINWALAK